MKNLVWVLLGLVLAGAWAQPFTLEGQRNVRSSLAIWSSAAGSYTGKTRVLFLANNVHVDTSSTGQATQMKRVDNAGDSCSQPFFISSDSLGGSRPIWEYRLWATTRAVDGDSSTVVFRVQTREVYNIANRTINYTPWARKGLNNGYNDVAIQDSIVLANVGVTTKTAQYSLFFVAGTQARLCPDDIAGTANGAGDSVWVDSIRVFVR